MSCSLDADVRSSWIRPQIRYCGDVLSWMAECFAQSTLKCGREVPRAPGGPRTGAHTQSCTATTEIIAFTRPGISVSLAGTKSPGAKDAAVNHMEREGDQEEAASRAGHLGHGAYKIPSFDDE